MSGEVGGLRSSVTQPVLIVQLKCGEQDQAADSIISYKLCTLDPEIKRKTMFFIRHGQSEWNAAQHSKQIHKMYGQIDHPLNKEGIEQALHLNESWKREQSKQV